MAAGQDKTGKDHQGAPARAWVWLDSAHDVIFSDRNRAALKQLAIRLSVAGFLVHLLLIFLARTLPHPPPIIAEAGGNYLAAISTPFNFILFYEVLTLIAALPASTTRSIASQFEIVSLIFIRDVFRDIAKASDLVTVSYTHLDVYKRQVLYEPVDVSASALEAARERIEREIDGVTVTPRVMDYTHGDGSRLNLGPVDCRERRLVVYIGSSIGNFEPHQAAKLLRRVRAGLRTGDSFLLGVDLAKEESVLLAAYDDAAGVTAAFNRNLLVRLNRELDAEFLSLIHILRCAPRPLCFG